MNIKLVGCFTHNKKFSFISNLLGEWDNERGCFKDFPKLLNLNWGLNIKIRWSSGFSLSLWSKEFSQVLIEDDMIRHPTQEGSWIKIQPPAYWNQDDKALSSANYFATAV